MTRYLRNFASATTRWLNTVFAGNDYREPMSSAVGRKAAQGRRLFVIAEASIDLLFAVVLGERHHCAEHAEAYRLRIGGSHDGVA